MKHTEIWRLGIIQAVPLRFLCAILGSSGAPSSVPKPPSSTFPSPLSAAGSLPTAGGEEIVKERVVRWRLRLQFFAYETLGDLRISELFDIIVDYPERCALWELFCRVAYNLYFRFW